MKFNLFKKTNPPAKVPAGENLTSDSAPVGSGFEGDGRRSSGFPFVTGNMYFGPLKYACYYVLWRFYWEANKAVNIRPKDMVREGWQFRGADVSNDALEAIEKYEVEINLREEIYDALIYERLYGGGVVLLGTRELNTDASQPLLIDNIGRDDLRFVRAFSRCEVSGINIEVNPLSQNYNRPKTFFINGQEVHRSRLLIFDGGGEKVSYGMSFFTNLYEEMDGFGYSVLEPIFDDIIRANGSRHAAYHLVNMLSIPMFRRRLKEGGVAYSEREIQIRESLKEIMAQMSNYNGIILDSKYELEQYQSNVQRLPELIKQQLEVVAAGTDIPAPRFLGQAPGGLNATGKGDLTNYYNSIASDQIIRLKPRLEKIKPILMRSAGLSVDPDAVNIEFNPLMQMSEKEQAEIRDVDIKNIAVAIDKGIGGSEWGGAEAVEREVFLNAPYKNDTVKNLKGDKNAL